MSTDIHTGIDIDIGQNRFSISSNHMEKHGRVLFPLPPRRGEEARLDGEIYGRFMQHVRAVPTSRMDVRIFTAIRFAADRTETPEDLTARILVDLGLRAPRRAFPAAFLAYVDVALRRAAMEDSDPPVGVALLRDHWAAIGEDPFIPFLSGRIAVGGPYRAALVPVA